MLFYPAALPLSRQTLTYTAGVIRAACTSQQPTSLEQIIGREGGGAVPTHRLTSGVLRWYGRNVGAWDPA